MRGTQGKIAGGQLGGDPEKDNKWRMPKREHKAQTVSPLNNKEPERYVGRGAHLSKPENETATGCRVRIGTILKGKRTKTTRKTLSLGMNPFSPPGREGSLKKKTISSPDLKN